MPTGLRWPVASSYSVSQGFGRPALGIEPTMWLQYDNGGERRCRKNKFPAADGQWLDVHPGVDIACPIGTPVYAPEAGKIVGAGVYSMTGEKYLMLRIQRTGMTQTILFFTHLYRVTVQVGSRVSRGAKIAQTGNSGWSTGPHLHWEVRVGPADHDAWMSTASGLWYRWNPQRLRVGGNLADSPLIVPGL